MNIINQLGNRCYPPFWWSKLLVIIYSASHILDNEAIDTEAHWEPCHKRVAVNCRHFVTGKLSKKACCLLLIEDCRPSCSTKIYLYLFLHFTTTQVCGWPSMHFDITSFIIKYRKHYDHRQFWPPTWRVAMVAMLIMDIHEINVHAATSIYILHVANIFKGLKYNAATQCSVWWVSPPWFWALQISEMKSRLCSG